MNRETWSWCEQHSSGRGSAGGGLAAALALRVRDNNEFKFVFQFLLFPMLDDRTCLRQHRPYVTIKRERMKKERKGRSRKFSILILLLQWSWEICVACDEQYFWMAILSWQCSNWCMFLFSPFLSFSFPLFSFVNFIKGWKCIPVCSTQQGRITCRSSSCFHLGWRLGMFLLVISVINS